jgi:apolipoprotein N-acyltransferase
VSSERAARTPRLARFAAVAGPGLLAGVGLALSVPPWGFWPLAFPSAALLWWRLGGLGIGPRFLAGYATGLALYVLGLWWAVPFNVYGGIVMMLLLGLGPAIACAATPPGRGRTPALAGAMVLLEMLRDRWPFGGMPLGGVALGQAAGPLAPTARIGGQSLVLGLVWLAGGGLGALSVAALRWWRRRRAGRREPAGWRELAEHAAAVSGAPEPVPVPVPVPAQVPVPAPEQVRRLPHSGARGLLVAGLVAIGSVAAIGVAGFAAPDGGRAVGTVRAAAVQGGGQRGLNKSQVDPAVVYAAQLDASARVPSAPRSGPESLVLWPEDVVALDSSIAGSPAAQQLGALAVRLDSTLLVGVTEPAPGRHFLNEVVAFGPDGRIVAHYEKVHRVPFGEYVPARGFFSHLANLSEVPLDAVPGHGNGVMRTPAATVGAMVSYEVFFPDRARIPTRAGAELLVVPTNTSSYATTQVPAQELAASRLRALEEGRDLVQAAPAGYSAVIDNDGTVHALSVLGRRQVLLRDVALRRGLTLYAHVGDWLAALAALAGVLGGWLAAATDQDEGTAAARRERSQASARVAARAESARS